MQLKSIQKLGGVALIAGSLCLAAYSFLFMKLLPYQLVRQDMTLGIMNPHWTMIAAVALVGVVLMMYGFAAAYSRMYSESGVTGFLGLIFLEIAYLMQAAKVTWEIFLYPVIAGTAPSLFKESIIKNNAHVALYRNVASLTIFIGILLFCLALVRSKKYPAAAGILIFTGALIYGLGPMLSVLAAMGGIVILSVGCLILGLSLMKEQK